MLQATELNSLIQASSPLILDGALATELESRGHDLNHPLWSALLLRDHPESIEQVHLDYYLAGADVAITASYQASIEGFRAHLEIGEDESISLVKRSVELASEARDTAYTHGDSRDRQLLVAGSVGPYGAYLADGSEYRGDYKCSKEELQNWHRPRIRALVDAGVDLLAVETMPQLQEIENVLEMLREEFPATIAWVSCTLVDSRHISDGTCIDQVLRVINQFQDVVVAFGVNCVPTDLVTDALKLMKGRTKLPLLCYPNSGEVYDADTNTWSGTSAKEQDLRQNVLDWQAAGASIIGGCCRTDSRHIRTIKSILHAGPAET